ncbi:hypothetical protein Q7689_00375 [Nocardiopsis tropica]|uniref:hypothetical protein n=1 Tax=Nocardiopsis tropica TaxID=109330 RepID=UPI002E86E8F6|nr:hypothetical protein [Nocardiopsis tropica]
MSVLHLRLWLLLTGMAVILAIPVAVVVWALTQEPVFVGLCLATFLAGVLLNIAWDRRKRTH